MLCLISALTAATGATAETSATAQLLPLARMSTFEIVVPKVEPAYIKYEKALPLELLSFTERNDKFWSIGTAFAIGDNTYVSAAHVLISGLGSGLGQPALRDAEGGIHAIDRILKHSMHEDYIVFSVREPLASQALSAETAPTVGSAVYAVGNALGEGVVIRDGLLTSQTPEEQDGRWKWLRFSAAASPGNSGGPLLDSVGRVIGLITAKSPNENLNYALPIERVLNGSSSASTVDVRASFGLPILRGQIVETYDGGFALPLDWKGFTEAVLTQQQRQYATAQRRLLEQETRNLPPQGNFARVAATLDTSATHALLVQQDDDSWGLEQADDSEDIELPNDGKLWLGHVDEILMYRIARSDATADFYQDASGFMDTLLRGMKFPRVVGTQAIRITSLGPPQDERQVRDRFGRVWQVRSWALGFTDLEFVTFSLPTPEGYAGMLHVATALTRESVREKLALMADYTQVAYRGTYAQWRNWLANRALRPAFLQESMLTVDGDRGLSADLAGLKARVTPQVIRVGDDSPISVLMGFGQKGAELTWSPQGLLVDDKRDQPSFIQILTQPRPSSGAGTRAQERWNKLAEKSGEYSGEPRHGQQFDSFWTRSVLGDSSGDRLIEVVMTLREKSLLPRQVTERRDELLAGIELLETPR
ncbi:MAG: trypsin-like peptidase domain-containing protein [Nevskiaceae bacterium]|jgi:hypothetical protein|nr:trypsin-like peptidase domain-containing protein [Nevskiaceae bacterium]